MATDVAAGARPSVPVVDDDEELRGPTRPSAVSDTGEGPRGAPLIDSPDGRSLAVAVTMPVGPAEASTKRQEPQGMEAHSLHIVVDGVAASSAPPLSTAAAAPTQTPPAPASLSPPSSPSPPPAHNSYARAMRLLLRPTIPVLDGQLHVVAGALVASFGLATAALLLREDVRVATGVNAGLIFGAAGSLVMTASIIATYLWQPACRRHINILLFNLAVLEFLLALSFALEPAWVRAGTRVNDGRTCGALSVVREFLIMCSTAWTTCMAIDLYYLMTDPFTSPRINRKTYRWLSGLVALLAAVIMGVFGAFDAPVAVGNFCWVGAKREAQNDPNADATLSIWLFIITPVAISMGTNVYVTFVSYHRFRDGLSATLKNRHVLLREGFVTTITLIVYSALLWGVYAGYWLASGSSSESELLSVLFAFLLSYRGSVAFILWCLYKHPIGATGGGDESEEAVRPQMNLALLDELVQYTTQGITMAVRAISAVPLDPLSGPTSATTIATYTLRSASSRWSRWNEIKFLDFHPGAFARLRRCFGIHEDEFLASLASCTTPKVSEGASGSFMFYSTNRSYIVKSLTAGESAFLHGILERYVSYMTSEPETFLTRFLGSYCIALYGRRVYFAVMENVFDVQHGVSIHQRYDIKGSWIDRNATKVRRGAETTCRHCNLTFRVGVGRQVCPNRAGSHEPNVVLKDMDLTTKLRFGPVVGKRLLKQLKRDSDFLCDQGIMDYSLLLGVIEVGYQVNQQNILTRDGSVFLDGVPGFGQNAHKQPPLPPLAAPRIKQSAQCLRTSEVVIGPGFYYIGLIDILQTWTWAKRFERFCKAVLLRKDPEGISAIPPRAYRNRFHRKLDEIIHLGHNVVMTPRHSGRGFHVTPIEGGIEDDDDDSPRIAGRDSTLVLRGVPVGPSAVRRGTELNAFPGDEDEEIMETSDPLAMTGHVRASGCIRM